MAALAWGFSGLFSYGGSAFNGGECDHWADAGKPAHVNSRAIGSLMVRHRTAISTGVKPSHEVAPALMGIEMGPIKVRFDNTGATRSGNVFSCTPPLPLAPSRPRD
jgi:hypothetical protein